MIKTPQALHCTAYFRSDIEGLRAIAILLVISAHFGIPGLSGGFVGVDIFFVISGYLITGVLLREYKKKSKFDLLDFYANRFRRLFPALATMLVATSFAAYFILPDAQNLAHSMAAALAAVWASNLYFAFADVDYFATETGNNIFLHTWSLGVEEQFYILWPALILLAFRLAAAKRPEKSLWTALVVVLVVSLISCLIITHEQPIQAFYLMPTRAWQFAAGAIIWLVVNQNSLTRLHSNYLALTGFLLLIASLAIINHNTAYPSVLALLPTLAICALLWSGSNPLSISVKLLSTKSLQWLGKISYSWYLWHWPVLTLAEHLMPVKGNFSNSFLVLVISLLLATATYYIVENPIRFGRAKRTKPVWQISITITAMILLNSQLLKWNSATENKLANLNTKYIEARFDLPFFYHDGCDDWYRIDQVKPCSYGNETAPNTVVLMGDSIGVQWFPALTHMFNPAEWRIIVLTKSSCPMVDEPFFYERIGREYTECKTWREKAITCLNKQKPDLIFLGSTASNLFTKEKLVSGTMKVLEDLSPSASTIYLIDANPVLNFDGLECLTQNHPAGKEKCSTQLTESNEHTGVTDTLKLITSEYQNTHWLETATFVCPDNVCKAEQNGIIVFRNSQHLTASFTAMAASHFRRQMAQQIQPES